MKPYAKQILPLIGLMMVIGTITKLAIPFLTSLAIDQAIDPRDGNPSLTLLYQITIAVLAMYIIQWVAGIFVSDLRISSVSGSFMTCEQICSSTFSACPSISSTSVRLDLCWSGLRMMLTPAGFVYQRGCQPDHRLRAVSRYCRYSFVNKLEARSCCYCHGTDHVLHLDETPCTHPACMAGCTDSELAD